MFLAPVGGRYGFFGPTVDDPREGDPYLLYNAGLSDPDTGAKFTVRRYTVEASESERTGTRIVLAGIEPADEAIMLSGAAGVRAVAAFLGWVA